MKRKWKMMLLIILVVPCLLFVTACSNVENITLPEYQSKVANSAVEYYRNKEGKSMTVEMKSNSINTWTSHVHYGENNEHGIDSNFKTTTEKYQKLEFYVANDVRNIRVTETEKTVENGYKENDAETGVVAYTNTEIDTTITTFAQGSGSFMAYVSGENKYNDEVDTYKKTYDFETLSEYADAVDEVLSDLDGIMEEGFFGTESLILMGIMSSDLSYYKEGDSKFGVKGSYSMPSISDKSVTESAMTYDIVFENNLPSKYISNMQTNTKNDHLEDVTMQNPVNQINATVQMIYSCNAISAPTGFADADEMYYAPSIDLDLI